MFHLHSRDVEDKERHVQRIFSSIASKYDFLNRLLSFNQDNYWRRFAISQSGLKPGEKALDVATGTGAIALELVRKVGSEGRVTGVDFCEDMLRLAQHKLKKLKYHNIEFIPARVEALPFPDNTFDCVTIGFGLRNVVDVDEALREMSRVMKEGGSLVCLEFSQPQGHIFRMLYKPYLLGVLPFIGRLISGSDEAYSYLPQSIRDFQNPQQLEQAMLKAGLQDIEVHFLTMGVVTVHIGVKKAEG
jgi:demethylmenaquinone methyltransferase/2-methoxy-6-polyprenyl-1,4-benzoquinol methylase